MSILGIMPSNLDLVRIQKFFSLKDRSHVLNIFSIKYIENMNIVNV